MTTADKVLDVLAQVSEREEVRQNLDMRLFDLQVLDSLQTIDLILALSQEFGIDISPAGLDREDWATPRKIVSYIEERMAVPW